MFRLQGRQIREQSQQHSALPWMASFSQCKSSMVGKLPKVFHEYPSLTDSSFQPIQNDYSNEDESLKIMEHIIIPYVQKQRNTLKLDAEYPAMLLMDVYKGQMTDPVKEILKRNNNMLQKVPTNQTYLFQPLDVQGGPNGYAKLFMKKKFTLWYADQVQRTMDGNRFKSMEDIDIDLKLSVLKPLHASWLIELFDHMTSPAGKAVSLKGWEVAGITDAVKKETSGLPSLDPFHDIDPLSFIPVAIEEDNSETINGEQRKCI